MANVQLENGYIRIAFDLFNELNFRDFNRMHLNILNFIIRLSYGCKKKYAYISPKSLFRLYGVNKNYIKQSLDYLINNKIIIVQNDKYYSINKNFDEWTVPYKAGVNFEEFKKIVSENLYSNHQNGDDYNHKMMMTVIIKIVIHITKIVMGVTLIIKMMMVILKKISLK